MWHLPGFTGLHGKHEKAKQNHTLPPLSLRLLSTLVDSIYTLQTPELPGAIQNAGDS